MSELLLELFSGEIPAMMQKKAQSAYKEIFTKYFAEHNIGFEKLDVYVSLRRLCIHASGISSKVAGSSKEVKGPKVGAPEQAIEGFCRSNKTSKDQLVMREVKGAEFYFYEEETAEKNTADILLKTLAEPIAEYVWPKSMYWGDYDIKWVRPLENILCIFDGKVVPFKYGHLTANDQCYGHRFMSLGVHKVKDFASYQKVLKDNYVVLDALDRQEIIASGLEQEAKKLDLVIKDDPALLEEVVGLAEYPKVLVGKIDRKFLSVPSEVLVSAMRSHQKYFSLFDKDGNFAPYFLFVSNIDSSESELVIGGNEKVLSARLADALYFYNQDLKTTLLQKSKRLEKVIFHAKLGTLKDKSERACNIAKHIAPEDKAAAEAALIAKADIVSEVVDEFPTLQGIMGYYYAKSEGMSADVAEAIRDHYKPSGPSDSCPKSSAATLALADKIDTLCGLFLADEKPSGSKDPFALRRQALGIIRIILENNLQMDLTELVEFTVAQFDIKSDKAAAKKDALAFLEERAKYFFKEEYDQGHIAAVLDFKSQSDLVQVKARLDSMSNFLKSEHGNDLLTAYKRVNNLLKSENAESKIDESLFASDYEITLHKSIKDCATKVESAISSGKYSEALEVLAGMRGPIAEFFDNVMVKDENPKIASNRMGLLGEFKGVFNKIARFDRV